MNYSYTVNHDANIKILTPGVSSTAEIKADIHQCADRVVNHSVYPNGFEIEMVQYAGSILITTNMPLTVDADGNYVAPTD